MRFPENFLETVHYMNLSSYDPSLVARDGVKGSFCLFVPVVGSPQIFLKQDSGKTLNWTAVGAGTGNIVGPVVSTLHAIPRYGNSTGTSLLNSGITIDNADILLSPSSAIFLTDLIQIGTLDGSGRTQIWNQAPNAILRLGSLVTDGDVNTSSSEGVITYGTNTFGDPMSGTDFGYFRAKSNLLGLYTSKTAGFVGYAWRLDNTEFFGSNDSGTQILNINRSTGATSGTLISPMCAAFRAPK